MAYLNEIIYPLPPLWNSSQIGRSRPAASQCSEPTGLVEEPIFEDQLTDMLDSLLDELPPREAMIRTSLEQRFNSITPDPFLRPPISLLL